jgi:DNA-binding IscR family transcriptional regulator
MLIHAIEGPVNLVNCSGPGQDKRRSCNLMDWCPVRAPVLKVHRRLQQFLEEVSLEEIVAERAAPASAEGSCQ